MESGWVEPSNGEGVCVRRGCVGKEGVWEKRVSMQGEGVREGRVCVWEVRMCMRGECECVRGRYVRGEGGECRVCAATWGVVCVCVTYLSRKVLSLLRSQEFLVDLVGSCRHCCEQATVPMELCHQQRNHPHWH